MIFRGCGSMRLGLFAQIFICKEPLGSRIQNNLFYIIYIMEQIWLMCKTAHTIVFDIISDIITRKRIISFDIMSKPFY